MASDGSTGTAAIVAEARAALAAGRSVDRDAFAARIRASASAVDAGRAIDQLDRVLAVARARTRLAQNPAPRPRTRTLRAAVRTKPILTANMDVRREVREGRHVLTWDAARGVDEWEFRIAERATARSDYETQKSERLPATSTSVDVPISNRALRIHLLGRARDGKLLRRAVVTGLSLDNWDERWQKRPSAA